MRQLFKAPASGQSKTWVLYGKTNQGLLSGAILYELVGHGKKRLRWRLPEGNPYLRTESRNTWSSRFPEVAMPFATVALMTNAWRTGTQFMKEQSAGVHGAGLAPLETGK